MDRLHELREELKNIHNIDDLKEKYIVDLIDLEEESYKLIKGLELEIEIKNNKVNDLEWKLKITKNKLEQANRVIAALLIVIPIIFIMFLIVRVH